MRQTQSLKEFFIDIKPVNKLLSGPMSNDNENSEINARSRFYQIIKSYWAVFGMLFGQAILITHLMAHYFKYNLRIPLKIYITGLVLASIAGLVIFLFFRLNFKLIFLFMFFSALNSLIYSTWVWREPFVTQEGIRLVLIFVSITYLAGFISGTISELAYRLIKKLMEQKEKSHDRT